MDDRLIDFAFDRLSPPERAVILVHLAHHPSDAAKVARLQAILKPLSLVRGECEPPAGLALAAIARTAEAAVAAGRTGKPSEPPTVPSLRRALLDPVYAVGVQRIDAVVAAAVLLLAVGLGLTAISKVRAESRVAACRANLHDLHVALDGYADTHGGRYPQAGTPSMPTAGGFVAELTRAGQVPVGGWSCPLADDSIGYAYTLGFQGVSGVAGLRRPEHPDAPGDWGVLAADLPPTAAGPAHGRGQNVLYAGGAVRFTPTTAAGWNGDDIYVNDAGQVRAGLHLRDASLGRPTDYP